MEGNVTEALNKALELWRRADLPGIQKRLDYEAEQISARKDGSDASRRTLIEKTRKFRGEVDDDTKKKVAPLMKQFQSEIDSLTKRGKAAEQAFLSVYKQLIDAPDPVALLESALTDQKRSAQNQELELENRRLQATIKEYHAEFAQIKNQEVTIKRLQDKVDDYEKQIENRVQGKAKEVERQLERKFSEREREIQEEALAVAKKLGIAEQQTATMRDALEAAQSELFDMKTKYDEDMANHTDETEMVGADLERTTQKLLSVQKELEMERERMAEMQKGGTSNPVNSEIEALQLSNLEKEITAKDHEIAQVLSDYRDLQERFAALRTSMDNQITGYEESLQGRTQEIANLKKTLEGQSDYATIKEELQFLKGIEFGAEANKSNANMSVEALLSVKSKALEKENGELKREVEEKRSRIPQLEAEIKRVSTIMNEQADLISRLEGDLTSVNISEAGQNTENDTRASKEAGNEGGTLALLPIVSSQRDRFRARNIELEAENRGLQQTIASLSSEISTVKSDNVKLYEKIKYVQGYQSKPSNDDTVNRYSTDYEEHINPFQAFNAKEKARKYNALSPADKMALSISRMVLANKRARLGFVIYICIIHFLIFTVLMRYSHHTSRTELSELCMHQFANHMHQAHPNENFFEVDHNVPQENPG
eukprot:m.29170 g.29170  ORF g.29170 m.29170 type:complete len:656 (+) comp8071_c0_seq1:257-2224(+)